ncbi:phospho-sugar mutase [uncultured Nocardioides sp.]|uniref:phospho-sugar mutase n=1 Tax=uncultured Nocardioides sp. TaxID=198441 RepID=UPI00262BFF22|nr:phospho-sugar mutase [uncultured Nocardioides sp.]
MTDDLRARARAWVAEDPDEQTRAELETLLARAEDGDEAAGAELADAFDGTLEFGTAGLRGRQGPGPNRMNRVVVTRAAAGLAAYLLAQGARPGDSVVIGYDARHHSDTYARDTAEVVTGAGLTALTLPHALPTPVLAYAIRELDAVAGVMVTASHNPPADNGYKVYLGDGSQIVSPADAGIAERIAAVGPLAEVPRGTGGRTLDSQLLDRYLDTVADLAEDGPRDLRVVYTPLHGVGGGTVGTVLEQAGFDAPHVVGPQEEPDPDFPTVEFPNPEEPGAMDLAMDLAVEVGADLVVANDPDADRCAAAVPAPATERGWRMLRGDEVGALLGSHLLARAAAHGEEGVYACSIVSSSLLGRMAQAAGQRHVETLTGFKWIGRVEGLAYGYEEALGYCVDPTHVRDKDGVSALLLLCEIAARAKADGRTLLDLLDDLAIVHGLHATDQVSVRVTDISQIDAVLARLRAQPPTTMGGFAVTSAEDLADGAGDLPPTDGLRYRLAEGGRVVVRPSGTEPKLKCYLEVVVGVDATDAEPDQDVRRDAVAAARIAAAGRLDAIRADLVEAAGL